VAPRRRTGPFERRHARGARVRVDAAAPRLQALDCGEMAARFQRTPRQQTAHLAAEARPRQRGPRRPRAGRSRIVRVVGLYRVFEWDGTSLGRTDGGPLYVARTLQGPGRHDNPSQFAAWYCSRDPASAVAESI